ncbi:MAG: hypothetical protein HYZ37_04880 [Candidatus Solibacter usitatus]|nr:hypothetical protein [Candidatus Solibacter usitatus]
MSKRETGTLHWSAPQFPYSIECPHSVLEQMRGHSLSGGNHSEEAGVLFGRRGEQLLRILAWRPISRRNPGGSRFSLSNEDRQDLDRLLEDAASDPELQVLHPLGWFVSHPMVCMSGDDVALYHRFFPERWQVTLVLEQTAEGPARAGFFFREQNGAIHLDATANEFAIAGARAAQRASAPAKPEPVQASRRLLWSAAGMAVLFCLLGAAAFLSWTRSPGNQSNGLQIHDDAGVLTVSWDGRSAEIAKSSSVMVLINDGTPLDPIAVDSMTAQRGSLTYRRRSQQVNVKLVIHRPGKSDVEKTASFSGPPVLIAEPELEAAQKETSDLREESAKLREQHNGRKKK